jgi:hypothetical protein
MQTSLEQRLGALGGIAPRSEQGVPNEKRHPEHMGECNDFPSPDHIPFERRIEWLADDIFKNPDLSGGSR